jgi:hypothetical protein
MHRSHSDAPSELTYFVANPRAWFYGIKVLFGSPRIVECVYKLREESKYFKARDVFTGYLFMADEKSLIPWDSELEKEYGGGR